MLVFPALFRGALDACAEKITEEMCIAAVQALAAVIPEEELSADYIIPDVFNPKVTEYIAAAVSESWQKGVK